MIKQENYITKRSVKVGFSETISVEKYHPIKTEYAESIEVDIDLIPEGLTFEQIKGKFVKHVRKEYGSIRDATINSYKKSNER